MPYGTCYKHKALILISFGPRERILKRIPGRNIVGILMYLFILRF